MFIYFLYKGTPEGRENAYHYAQVFDSDTFVHEARAENQSILGTRLRAMTHVAEAEDSIHTLDSIMLLSGDSDLPNSLGLLLQGDPELNDTRVMYEPVSKKEMEEFLEANQGTY